MRVGSRDPAMGNVADDRHLQIIQSPFSLTNGGGVEERLSWMFMGAVAAIDDARLCQLSESVGRAGSRMPDDDAVRRHRIECFRGIDQSFAFAHATSGGRNVHDVRR